jgi:two-component system cell cycle sensor histidine kinase/response regulator CckA
VEADEGVRSGLTRTLKQDGCRVLPAGDVHAAIQLVAGLDLPVDLIITNISIAYLEGHTLLEELARARHHAPVLFISTEPPPIPHGVPAEPSKPTPFSPEVLRSTVHRLLGLEHRETRESEETA